MLCEGMDRLMLFEAMALKGAIITGVASLRKVLKKKGRPDSTAESGIVPEQIS